MKSLDLLSLLETSGPPSLIALLSYLSSRRNKKAIQEVHVSLNSRLSELLKAARGEAFQEGLTKGTADGTAAEVKRQDSK